MVTAGPTWFAVQVRAGREHLSSTHLEWRGYEVFLPTYLEHKRWSDRVRRYERALFAGYLFCRMTPLVTAKLIGTPGVIRVVADEVGPLPIPDAEMDAIRRVLQAKLAITEWPYVRVGQRVRIIDGPLRELEGIVVSTKGRRWLVLSVEVLHRSLAVEIDAGSVTVPIEAIVAEQDDRNY